MARSKQASPFPHLGTRSARYFLSLFRMATLKGAVELAAKRERGSLLSGFEDYCSIPVDVEEVWKRKGFRIADDLAPSATRDAELSPFGEGFLVRFKPGASQARRRFTIAHEIGHSFFFRHGRHQVGLLDAKEMRAEEWICSQFASAFLVPPGPLRQLFAPLESASPWAILWQLDNVARRFQVSVEVIVRRLCDIKLPIVPVNILALRYQENQRTGTNPQLRVWRRANQGCDNPFRTFWNRSAEGLHLQSALNLFDRWRDHLVENREGIGGRYAWHPSLGLFQPRRRPEAVHTEGIELSVCENGQWSRAIMQTSVASFLYALRNCTDREAYIISVLRPKPQSG